MPQEGSIRELFLKECSSQVFERKEMARKIREKERNRMRKKRRKYKGTFSEKGFLQNFLAFIKGARKELAERKEGVKEREREK